MTAPTSLGLASAIDCVTTAAKALSEAVGKAADAAKVTDAVQSAVANLEEAAGRFDLDEVDDAEWSELADQVARLHYDEHEGALRFCSRACCRTAFEFGTEVVA